MNIENLVIEINSRSLIHFSTVRNIFPLINVIKLIYIHYSLSKYKHT